MKYLKRFNESLDSNEVEFISIVKDKLLEVSDNGFNVRVEDKNNEPLLGDMIRVNIEKMGRVGIGWVKSEFTFSECEDVLSDIVLTNKDMKAFKIIHIIITPYNNRKHYNLEYVESTGKFHPEGNLNPNLNYINPIRTIELYFENN
jgi:hypothetical protein